MLRTRMPRTLFWTALCSLLVACTQQETQQDRTLDCDRLTDQAWRATCGRFEAQLELIGGHGMSSARRSWGCSMETLRRVYCAGAPSPDQLQALHEYGIAHSGDNDSQVNSRLLACVAGMQLFTEAMAKPAPQRHPLYANMDCTK